ncbi:MAG TPA: universal stress protein, partial [Longilinea sp.]|nr:universal stress protein [Longilinea sp.]
LEGITVHTHLITSANTAAELHQIADQENIDLVTLSAHGYSGDHQWPYGSLVNNFIMYSHIPLLIVQDLPNIQNAVSLGQQSREQAEH